MAFTAPRLALPDKLSALPYGGRLRTTVLNASTIQAFAAMEHHRPVTNSHVRALYRALRDGKQWAATLSINRRKEGTTIIFDGNHRFEALKLYFERFPTAEVEVAICYYENLSSLSIWTLVGNFATT